MVDEGFGEKDTKLKKWRETRQQLNRPVKGLLNDKFNTILTNLKVLTINTNNGIAPLEKK